MRIAIVADTHLPRGTRELPERCVEELRGADLIVHAGDFSTGEVLEQFRGYGPPLVAVHGNVDDADVRRELPAEIAFDAGGAVLGVVHDAGPSAGRLERMRIRFPDAAAVIFGHSHMPLLEEEDASGFQIFNPGSPTERRRAPTKSMGIATVTSGAVRFRHVRLR